MTPTHLKPGPFFVLIWILLAMNCAMADKIIVSTADQLEDAVDNAQPGDTIEVRNGIYDTEGSITMYNSGTVDAPIVIRAQERGQVELTGESYFSLRQCEYVVIEGFLFTSLNKTAVKLEACNNIRVTRNIFRLQETSSRKWVVVQCIWNDPNALSHHNRIDHNLFENKHMPGNFITIDGSPEPAYQSSQHDRIDHNHFRNIGPRHENEMEAVRIGWSELSMSSGFTVVEYNLFEDCDGDPEVISVKTSDNIIRYNTIRRSRGTLSLRHGNRSVVAGNFFFGESKSGTGGIRMYGDDHQIYNNYFEGLTGTRWDAPITLTNGDYDGGGSLSRHFRINRALIAHNTLVKNDYHIEIGFTNNGKYSKPPRDVKMINNLVWGKQSELVKIITSPQNMTWEQNLMFPDSAATLGIFADPEQIMIANPELSLSEGIWKLSSSSLAVDSGAYIQALMPFDDADGQLRDQLPDIGADEYAAGDVIRFPLTAADVGPDAGDIVTGIADSKDAILPTEFRLDANFPNPFNPVTHIRFALQHPSMITLTIFDVNGKHVETLIQEIRPAGEHTVQWHGETRASGVYYYQLKTEFGAQTRKMILLR